MRKKGAALHIFGIIATVLLLLTMAFGLFSYLYVSENQNYLTKRDFRLLGALSTEVKLRVENYSSSVLINLADQAVKECLKHDDPCLIRTLPKEAKKLFLPNITPGEPALRQKGDLRSRVAPRVRAAPNPPRAQAPQTLAEAGRDPRLKELMKKAQEEFPQD